MKPKSIRVFPASRPLKGRVRFSGDKSIAHRAIICAALGDGTSKLHNVQLNADLSATLNALKQLGIESESKGSTLVVHGRGMHGLAQSQVNIDCGHSASTMRMLAGLLSWQHFGSRLVGSERLMQRPMRRVLEPLRARGAMIAGRPGSNGYSNDEHRRDDPEELHAPINIAPLLQHETLKGLEYSSAVASAQVKTAMLLSGLVASGPTLYEEPYISRDHTERLLMHLGVGLQSIGNSVCMRPVSGSMQASLDKAVGWMGFELEIPGDISSASVVLALAAMIPGSDVIAQHVSINPTRLGLMDALRWLGADVEIVATHSPGVNTGLEPVGNIRVKHRPLGTGKNGLTVDGELLVRMLDEVPACLAVATQVRGQVSVDGGEELRVKESDRLLESFTLLKQFGANVMMDESGRVLVQQGELLGSTSSMVADHRMIMMAVMLALVSKGSSVLHGVEPVDKSFPNFFLVLEQLGMEFESLT